MINPSSICVAIPAYDGKVVVELCGSLVACSYMFGAVSLKPGISHVALARNFIAQQFLRSKFEWLVMIDSDIAFAPQDFRLLMEPTITSTQSGQVAEDQSTPSRVQVASMDEKGRLDGFIDADMLVTAEYSYKNDTLAPCRMGLGFTRVHRSVFDKISQIEHEDGQGRAWQYTWQGEMFTDYFPCGLGLAQNVATPDWKGEDIGFFTMCALAGIIPRIETRTYLHHVGVKAYPYIGDGGGQ